MIGPRWVCKKCGGTEVQISLPAWHRESADFELTYIETDTEAEPMYWWCESCQEGGRGQPDEIGEPTEETAAVAWRPLGLDLIRALGFSIHRDGAIFRVLRFGAHLGETNSAREADMLVRASIGNHRGEHHGGRGRNDSGGGEQGQGSADGDAEGSHIAD